MLKKTISYLLSISLLSITLLSPIKAVDYIGNGKDSEVIRTSDYLNQIRKQVGAPKLKMSQALNQASYTHSRYMSQHQSFSSIEDKDKLYYRGRYPWDRAVYEGYEKHYAYELISQGVNNYQSSINRHLANPYYRQQLLNPLYTDIGMGRFHEYTTCLLGGEALKESRFVSYPYKGQKGVPIRLDQKEGKPIYGLVDLSDQNYRGFPLTFTYYDEHKLIKNYYFNELSLRNLNRNQKVPIRYVVNHGVNELRNSLLILPLQEFKYQSSYKLKIKGTVFFDDNSQKRINEEIEFTTVANAETGGQRLLTRSYYVEQLLKALDYKLEDSLEIIFADVNVNAPNYKYIYTAYKNDLVKGSYGNFYPESNIKIQDAYVVLIRAYEQKWGRIKLKPNDEFPAGDKIISQYARESLNKAYKIGLIDDESKNFEPFNYITEKEFKKIIQRFQAILMMQNS